ncbi:hypothetical protein BJ742DRAFT_786017 [Cladochytrium replicatum]|nr:hypothetical protein BJ742DRAFT_786017 [Cladochytrium replicatum]
MPDAPLELLSYGPALSLPSFDPFCLAVQTYLNMAGVDWTLNDCNDPTVSSTGQLPVLRDGPEAISGWSEAIAYVRAKGFDLDEHLSPLQKAEAEAYASLIENTLYDAMLYTMFIEQENYSKGMRPALSRTLPWTLRFTLPEQMRGRAVARVENGRKEIDAPAGWSNRITRAGGGKIAEVYVKARDVYRVVSTKLGEKEFFFGPRPTTIDAILFGHLAIHSYPSFAHPTLFALLTFEFPTLLSYVSRIRAAYFTTEPRMATGPLHAGRRADLLVKDLWERPGEYVKWMGRSILFPLESIQKWWEGKKKSGEDAEKKGWEEFGWRAGWTLGAVTFFVGYVAYNRIIEIDFEEEDSSSNDSEEGSDSDGKE